MPYIVKRTERGAYRKFSGIVSMDELLGSLSKVQCDPNYARFMFSVVDFLDVEKIDFDNTKMQHYGAQVIGGQYTNPSLVIGIVVTDPDTIAVLKTRYEPLVQYPVGYFSTLQECQQWIEEKTGTSIKF
jgi:hypothetical protein